MLQFVLGNITNLHLKFGQKKKLLQVSVITEINLFGQVQLISVYTSSKYLKKNTSDQVANDTKI